MYFLLGIAVVVCGASQVVGAEENIKFHYKMPELYASMLTQMEQGVNGGVDVVGGVMEQQCPFAKVADQYQEAIYMVDDSPFRENCPTLEHKLILKTMMDKFYTSKDVCLTKTGCRTDFADTTAKVLKSFKELDTQAFKDSSACTNTACKRQVQEKLQEKLQENLFKMYKDSQQQLTADQSTKCRSSMEECMTESNKDNIKEMSSGIAELQNCVATSGTVDTVIEEGEVEGVQRPTWRP